MTTTRNQLNWYNTMPRIISIRIQNNRYLYATNIKKDELHLEETEETNIANKTGSSRFLFSKKHHILAKIKQDKYIPSAKPLRWLGRIIHERVLLQSDSIKEYQGNKAFISAGLNTIKAHGYAVAINPMNQYGSIFFMEYEAGATRGSDYFNHAIESDRIEFLHKFCRDIIKLAKSNYYCRDAHFGNTLIGVDKEITWVDTHVYRMPFLNRNKYAILSKYFVRKIPSAYQIMAEQILSKSFHLHR